MMTDRPAILGGKPLLDRVKPRRWPPRYAATERTLVRLYREEYWSFNGPFERKFCEKFAEFQGAEHCVFMMNGTVTLEAALYACGIGPGDEVLTPAVTWVATAAAVLYVGATPVFVDVDPRTLCLDPEQAEAAITPRTRAVIPVHLYGSMADMDAVLALAARHELVVIEDASHAHGGRWAGRGTGTLGRLGSFSFQESKPLAAGEGGAVLTNDPELAQALYRYKHIGYPPGPRPQLAPGERYSPPGFLCRNYRATEFQAAILLGQLRTLGRLTRKRSAGADFLHRALAEIPGIRTQAPGRRAAPQSYYMFVITFDGEEFEGIPRDVFLRALAAEGLRAKGLYGSVPRHPLWNVEPKDFRVQATGADQFGPCCARAVETCARSVAIPHVWLLENESVLERIAAAVKRIRDHAGELRDL